MPRFSVTVPASEVRGYPRPERPGSVPPRVRVGPRRRRAHGLGSPTARPQHGMPGAPVPPRARRRHTVTRLRTHRARRALRAAARTARHRLRLRIRSRPSAPVGRSAHLPYTRTPSGRHEPPRRGRARRLQLGVERAPKRPSTGLAVQARVRRPATPPGTEPRPPLTAEPRSAGAAAVTVRL
ncbi:hypothetical protein [Streptomyces sp. NPDC088254]|uniref:hypothetical protein n=1 Tax=Streptomyces sp. NPDC088254 TaxID=3365847 RepID=UPI003812BB1F